MQPRCARVFLLIAISLLPLLCDCDSSGQFVSYGIASPTYPLSANGAAFPQPPGASLPGFPVLPTGGAAGPSWQTAVFGTIFYQP